MSHKPADLLKKTLSFGIGAAFLTEESIRSVLGEMKLPKETFAQVFDQIQKTKSDFFEKLSQDILEKVQSQIEPKAFIEEMLQKHEIELEMKIRFKPKETSSHEG
jgi:replicative DNA helicase